MLEPKIPLKKLKEFERDYFDGKFPHQRYGQAFCNYFNKTDSILFYEETTWVAMAMVWCNLVEEGE